MRTIWRTFSLLVLAAAAGCAGPTLTADTAPEYRVTHAQTKFYRLGPQQAGPPDAFLAIDDHVRLLRRELGYSLALLDNGETGYIANEDLEPAARGQLGGDAIAMVAEAQRDELAQIFLVVDDEHVGTPGILFFVTHDHRFLRCGRCEAGRLERQPELEARAHARLLEQQVSAVSASDLARERQAEPHADRLG